MRLILGTGQEFTRQFGPVKTVRPVWR